MKYVIMLLFAVGICTSYAAIDNKKITIPQAKCNYGENKTIYLGPKIHINTPKNKNKLSMKSRFYSANRKDTIYTYTVGMETQFTPIAHAECYVIDHIRSVNNTTAVVREVMKQQKNTIHTSSGAHPNPIPNKECYYRKTIIQAVDKKGKVIATGSTELCEKGHNRIDRNELVHKQPTDDNHMKL